MIIDIAYHLFVIQVGAGIGLALVRLLRGPSIADRINAADMIAICCVGLTLGHGWRHGQSLWLDVAVVAALVLFVGTTAVALFIDPDELVAHDTEAQP